MSNHITRDLRFEQLRVCAIIFVVAHHVLLFGVDGCGYLSQFVPSASGVVCVVLNSLFVTGVNLFVMISGWFGIKRVWRPMVRLVVECGVFGAVALSLSLWLYGLCPIDHVDGHWSWMRLWQSLKFTNWWFVVHYLMLVLAAPLLELALKDISQKNLERILCCVLLFNFVFGFWWGYVNTNGYNVINFVMLYLLARYMRLFPQSGLCRAVRRWRLWIVVACITLMTLWFLCDQASWVPGHMPMVWNYNDPLVVAEAMALFMMFAEAGEVRWRVNLVAPYVLGIYLLQSSPNLVYYRNALGHWLWTEWGFAGMALDVVLLFVGSLVLSVAVFSVLRRVLGFVRL